MAVKWAIASGNWSSTSTWNGGTLPAAGDDVWSNTYTVNVDQNINVGSLNNTARARDIATVQMLSNNTPAPYVAAANAQGSGTEAYRAFDRNYAAASNSWTTAGTTTGWLSYDFSTGIVIDGYTIYGTSIQNLNPRNWTLEGSNDNTNWTVLHTVTQASAIPANGTFSINTIGNSTSYRYYRLNISLNGGNASNLGLTELELYTPTTAALTAGGGFNFNTAGVTASITGATPLSIGAANLLTFSHSTGAVSASLSNSTSAFFTAVTTITYSGNGDLNFTCPNINISANGNNTIYISKTGSGTLTVTANLQLSMVTNSTPMYLINSTNGNTILNGNLSVLNTNVSANNNALIRQTVGNLTITGNVTAPINYVNNLQTVNFSGTNLTINGNLLSNVGQNVISTGTGTTTITGDVYGVTNASGYGLSTSNTTTITGNVIGNTSAAVISSAANVITINGNISASSANNAIQCTNVGAQLILSGSLYNTNGKQAAFVPNLLANQSAPMVAQFFTPGLQNITMYSQDTLANYPSASNVRQGTVYGVASGSTGTLAIPSSTDVRSGVTYDATTTGSGLFTTALLLSEISSSNVAVAARLRNAGTTEILGNLLAAYKK